jgi:predicted PurR-regulated permease PerM
VTLLFLVVFMLASGRQLIWSAMARVPPERRATYADVLSELYRSLGGYIGGLFLIVLSDALFSGVFLAAIGVKYFLPLAVFAGLSSLVPYAGAITAGALISLVAWSAGGTWLGLGTLAYFLAYQLVESHIIAPVVYRQTVDLNPVVVLVVVLFMAELNGIPGAVIAVPLAATVQILLRELFRLRLPRAELGPEPLDAEATRSEGSGTRAEPRRAPAAKVPFRESLGRPPSDR